jgi:hypothetical protein
METWLDLCLMTSWAIRHYRACECSHHFASWLSLLWGLMSLCKRSHILMDWRRSTSGRVVQAFWADQTAKFGPHLHQQRWAWWISGVHFVSRTNPVIFPWLQRLWTLSYSSASASQRWSLCFLSEVGFTFWVLVLGKIQVTCLPRRCKMIRTLSREYRLSVWVTC